MPFLDPRILLVAALLGAGFYAGYRWSDSRLGPLQAEISRLQARDVIMETANAQCTQNVAEANRQTDELIAGQKAREKRSAVDLAAARTAADGFRGAIDQLRLVKPPADTGCEVQAGAARALIADEIRGRK